ncbi:hypothetical protein D9756_004409 [Leucocoprinus leucothites]|uniref:HAUS augmin-like complex subunit 6 N-terminal domain-containing protein n=1 Tax=Leucocoprinus leucothites TaxID=201217 RepID=A0A8H5LDX6_9AGAR|nr:hypothetical protein D9756_004409 [Leucoagaricus leucothites]
MSSACTTLPLPLLLLIHLHILEYPRVNEPQYDKNLFDRRSKGLKDRVRMMEDICYFLVSLLESGARNILPTHPCSRPSDSLAFRTSLSKFLETLRHHALFLSSKKMTTNPSTTPKTPEKVDQRTSWWWKDVVVRKSLLEECAGERFECLLVAFSTHVLLHKTRPYTQDQLSTLSSTVYNSYNNKLLYCQSSRRLWLQKANLLSQRSQKLNEIKRIIEARREDPISRTNGLNNILGVTKLKYLNVQKQFWPGARGSTALVYLLRLTGLTPPDDLLFSLHEGKEELSKVNDAHSAAPPLFLPLAAARYPTELKRLRRSVFPHLQNTRHSGAKTSHSAQLYLSDDLASIKAIHKRLSEALRKVQHKQKELLVSFLQSDQRKKLQLQLMTPTLVGTEKLLRKPIVNHALLARLLLHDPAMEDSLEQKIDYMHHKILLSYPSPPDCPPCMTPLHASVPFSYPRQPKPGRGASDHSDVRTPRSTRMGIDEMSVAPSIICDMIKRVPEESNQLFENEASKIILSTENDSIDDNEATTPKFESAPNRVWTSGQKKTPGSVDHLPRRSIATTFVMPLKNLPLVTTSSTGSISFLDDENQDKVVESDSVKVTGCAALHDDKVSDIGEESQTSMTLRELLLMADSNALALIDDEEKGCFEQFSGWE